ncbi:MAG: hypothetical protein AAB489_01715 [Patescibacteria group bacterium]
MYTHIFARGFQALFGIPTALAAAARIRLFEPIVGGCPALTATPGLGTFFTYFNQLWPWLIGTSAGIALLMALVGGLQVILSGGDQSKRQEGLDRLKNAFLGLLMLAFAGLILTTLNPSFFKGGAVGAPGC